MNSLRRKGIQSVEVGGRLLKALAAAPQPMMLRDLAAAALMPASKAHRYLVSFARFGLVEQDTSTGRYDLGAFALNLGLAALGRLEPVNIAAPRLQGLAEATGQTMALAVWANHGATIVRWVGSDAPVAASLRIGSVMPLTRSATGRIFLAHLAEARWRGLLKKELAGNAKMGLSPANRAELNLDLSQIRTQGFSYADRFIVGISGMAVPVFDGNGSIVLALIALGYSAGFELLRQSIQAAMLGAARELSARLGREHS